MFSQVILNTHKVYGKMFPFIISNVYVWLVLLPYMQADFNALKM